MGRAGEWESGGGERGRIPNSQFPIPNCQLSIVNYQLSTVNFSATSHFKP
ncbi:MAG: hypothetical protein HC849_14985 [Oscillatoriales cyanobacterium RU_3_3]|nr:hypothetical protein [Microcoleus sp. SU_5_6]NJL68657.1 hypothetical protein [Microcoleus sp. SM1_3_4]NJM61211.1 hypothetical protein [Oscillatoriales cyanobacterium RU_3_3]NJR26499.1 hypothetical protein [Richelia sp. CSU_2_1]